MKSQQINIEELSNLLDDMTEKISEIIAISQPVFGGEHFVSDKELSEMLKVSRRTLQQWRTDGLLAYYQVGGKVLYKESDVDKLLESYYIAAYNREC